MIDVLYFVEIFGIVLPGLVDGLAQAAQFDPAIAPQRFELASGVLVEQLSHLLVVLEVLVVVELAFLAHLLAAEVFSEVVADKPVEQLILAEDAVGPIGVELLLVLLDSLPVVAECCFVELVEERCEYLHDCCFEEVVGEIVAAVYLVAFECNTVDPLVVLLEVVGDFLDLGEMEQLALAQVVELLEVPKHVALDLVLLVLSPQFYGERRGLHERARLHEVRALDFLNFLQDLQEVGLEEMGKAVLDAHVLRSDDSHNLHESQELAAVLVEILLVEEVGPHVREQLRHGAALLDDY